MRAAAQPDGGYVQPGRGAGVHPCTLLAPAILGLSVGFNFGLCSFHTLVRPVSATEVIVAEVVLIGLAACSGFVRLNSLNRPWLYVLLCQLVLLFGLSFFREELLLKPIRDVIMVPIFVALGLSAHRLQLGRILLFANTFVVSVALAELVFVDVYLDVCNVSDYFYSKGDAQLSRAAVEDGLFASGLRPNGRFLFGLSGDHRVSSIFLEPVSLGFFGLITGMFFLAMSQCIGPRIFWAGISTSVFLVVLADGRLAFGVLAACAVGRIFFSKLTAGSAAFLFPGLVLLSWVVVESGTGARSGEGVAVRLVTTFDVLSAIDVRVLLGLGGLEVREVVDTGFGYLLETQGLAGAVLFWLMPILLHSDKRGPARIYVFFVALYVGFGFLFSAAIFTIKTAAILWFSYGYLVAKFAAAESSRWPLVRRSEDLVGGARFSRVAHG